MTTQLKLALRVLGRRKAFTAISLIGIALTLSVLTVATAILDNLLAPQKPESRFDRVLGIARLGQYGPENGMTAMPGYGFLEKYMRTLPNIEESSILSQPQTTAVYQSGQRVDTVLKRTDAAFWRILDFDFIEGHPYSAADDAAGRTVAVITDKLSHKLFGNGSAIGKTLNVDGENFRVIGVVPHVPFSRVTAYADVWVPLGTYRAADYRTQTFGSFQGIVLARDKSDFAALKREFSSRVARVPVSDPKLWTVVRGGLDTRFEALSRFIASRQNDDSGPRTIRTILIVATILFMTLPALNLITLNLSRIMERASEIGVRRAFGAPRGALIRQFVFENVVLTLIGGVGGFLLALIAVPVLNRISPLPDAQFALNVRVFFYGMLLAAFFGVFSGVYPAWKMSRLQPVNALRGGSQ
jgi:putative ABC transport system permease protein